MKHCALLSATLLLSAACSTPPLEPYSQDDLQPVRDAIAVGDWDEAWSLIRDLDWEYFDRPGQGEYSLLAGTIAYERGDHTESIRHYEQYLLFEGPTSESRLVEQRLFEMGIDLIEGRNKILGIFPDRSRGVSTLLNLATYAPLGEHAAEALARVGEYHYTRRYYEDAIEDYRLILRHHRNSEWADLASFRIGMCGYLQIDGPWVDGRLIDQSRNQLREYLKQFPSGLYRVPAEETLVELEELSARRELELGDYYEDIGNTRGARQHYREAATRTGTQAALEAQQRLEGLPPVDPPLPPVPGGGG